MIEKDNIDDLFKGSLSQPSAKYSPEHWAAMESMLDTKGLTGVVKSRFNWRRWSVVLAILLIFSAIFVGIVKHTANESVVVSDGVIEEHTTNRNFNANKDLNLHEQPVLQNDESQDENEIKHNFQETTQNKVSGVFEGESHRTLNRYRSYSILDPGLVDSKTSFDSSSNSLGIDSLSINKPNSHLYNLLPISIPGFPIRDASPFKAEPNLRKSLQKPKFFIGFQSKYYDYDKTKPQASNMDLDEVENPIQSYGHEVYVGMKKNNWSYQLGVGISTLRERTNYQKLHEEYAYDTSYQLIRMNHDFSEDGRPLALIYERVDTITNTSIERICPNCETTFRYIDIPISIKYSIGQRRLRPSIQLSEIVSFPIKANGYYTDSDNIRPNENGLAYTTERISSTQMGNLLLQTEIKLGATYSLTSKINTQIGVAGSLFHTSMMKNYNQRALVNSIQIGLEYEF